MDGLAVLVAQVAVFTLGTLALALFGGAGGAFLLELYFRPRRDRKRAATLLLHEVNLNLQVTLHTRQYMAQSPDRGPPSDLTISHTALDLVGASVSALPAATVSQVLIVYHGLQTLERMLGIYDRDQHSLATSTGQDHQSAMGDSILRMRTFFRDANDTVVGRLKEAYVELWPYTDREDPKPSEYIALLEAKYSGLLSTDADNDEPGAENRP